MNRILILVLLLVMLAIGGFMSSGIASDRLDHFETFGFEKSWTDCVGHSVTMNTVSEADAEPSCGE